MNHAKNAYLEAEILSAEPTRLIQILFDQAVRATMGARDCLRSKDILNRGRHINQAFAILAELQNSLDFERGGEIAKNYSRLYDYCQKQLLAAHQQASDTILVEVESLLRDMADAWSSVHAKESALPKLVETFSAIGSVPADTLELAPSRISYSF